MTTLAVRLRGALLCIEPSNAPADGDISTVRLGLAGGALRFDVTASDPIPAAEVHDIDAASWWLISLYGPEASERIVRFAVESEVPGPAAPDGVDVTLDRLGVLGDALRRLALALWLRRWWPSPSADVAALSEWLLDVEAGALASDLEYALDPAFPLAEQLLEPHLARVATALADHDARIDRVPDAAIDAVLLAAARAALDVVDPAADGFDELAAAEAAVSASDRAAAELRMALDDVERVGAELDDLRAAGHAAGTRPTRALAHALGAEASFVPTGTAPVDPRSVRARVLSTALDAIAWRVDDVDGGRRCEVSVQIAPGVTQAPRLGDLFARIDYGGTTSAVALEFDGSSLRGTAWLDATSTVDDLAVGVYTGSGRRDAIAVRSIADRRTDRDALQRVAAARSAAAAGGPGDAWNAPFAAELEPFAAVPPK